jgi:hypothetical protein
MGRTFRSTLFRERKARSTVASRLQHRLPDRVRAHVFLAMPAYYVEWHKRWRPFCLMMKSTARRT